MSGFPFVEPWLGVDFDATLGHYTHWTAPEDLGDPIQETVNKVKKVLERGIKVKIMTARAWHDGTPERMIDAAKAIAAIQQWTQQVFGKALEVTCVKDMAMIELWDDRAVQFEANTGKALGFSPRGLI